MRDLEPHYHVSEPPNPYWNHLHETIASLGGIKGLTGIVAGVFLFYCIVVWVIDRDRQKRSEKKKKEGNANTKVTEQRVLHRSL